MGCFGGMGLVGNALAITSRWALSLGAFVKLPIHLQYHAPRQLNRKSSYGGLLGMKSSSLY